jgi:hypothetical protein
MTSEPTATLNGLRFKLVFFDYIYMLGELLSALSELHVKIQLVDRYCNKVLHNLRLLSKQQATGEQIRAFIRAENQELVKGLERQNMFYDKYRLSMLRIHHAGTEGELLVEDSYNGSQFVVPVKRIVSQLLAHVFDSTTIQEMSLFAKELEVMAVTTAFDAQPGETEKKVRIQLNDAAQNVHVYVKKEKLAGVEYAIGGQPVTDRDLIARAEAQETDKDRFLKDPLVRTIFPRAEVAVQ